MKKTLKAISPLIASILLIVVAVILVTIVLAFGKGFTTDALDKTQSTFTDWDFSTVWAISPTINEGYPYLRNNPPR